MILGLLIFDFLAVLIKLVIGFLVIGPIPSRLGDLGCWYLLLARVTFD